MLALPDWSGETVAILASGASAKKAPVALLRNRMRVIAIKEGVQLAPFADIVYSCDRGYWRQFNGLPDFRGLKVGYEAVNGHTDICRITVLAKSDDMLDGPLGTVGAGGNSGFQATNLAVQMGARRILFVGLDLKGDHWFGRTNFPGRSNPAPHNFARWVKAFTRSVPFFQKHGVEVINASPDSALGVYPRMTIEQALKRWELCDAGNAVNAA